MRHLMSKICPAGQNTPQRYSNISGYEKRAGSPPEVRVQEFRSLHDQYPNWASNPDERDI